MRPLRICLGLPDQPCVDRTRNPGGRCRPCEQEFQRRRNALERRREYRTAAYQRRSRLARARQPWCSICGSTVDATWDHEHRQVECRSCNSSHRRNPSP